MQKYNIFTIYNNDNYSYKQTCKDKYNGFNFTKEKNIQLKHYLNII